MLQKNFDEMLQRLINRVCDAAKGKSTFPRLCGTQTDYE